MFQEFHKFSVWSKAEIFAKKSLYFSLVQYPNVKKYKNSLQQMYARVTLSLIFFIFKTDLTYAEESKVCIAQAIYICQYQRIG